MSDYNKGVINDIKINTDMLIVDPKKDDFSLYKNAHIITPNLNELKRATNIDIEDDQSIIQASNDLITKHNFNYVVAKKGAEGMIVVGKNNFVKHIKPFMLTVQMLQEQGILSFLLYLYHTLKLKI